MGRSELKVDIKNRLPQAVATFWKTRATQSSNQAARGDSDRGSRGAVTGGAHMAGFEKLLTDIILDAGTPQTSIFRSRGTTLPGHFRPCKQWDLTVVHKGKLLVGIELKSLVGSFGNNFNNRCEEAIGSSTDLWTAFREGRFKSENRPWLGYLFLLQSCEESTRSSKLTSTPHFEIDPAFKNSSYEKRCQTLCERLVLERLYDASCFITSTKSPRNPKITMPNPDLGFESFTKSLWGFLKGHFA